MGFALKEVAPNLEHIGIVYNPEPGNNSSIFRKSTDDVASKVGDCLDRDTERR
jgi:putative ABC transport system substrate-binding protein